MNFKAFYISIFVGFFLFGCKKPIENPHTLHPYYGILESNLAKTTSELAALEKEMEKKIADLNSAKPQTSQVAFARNHYFATKKKIDRLKQEEASLKIQIEHFKYNSKVSYIRAFEKNEAWPKEQLGSSISSYNTLKEAPRDWSYKNRLKISETKPKVAATQ